MATIEFLVQGSAEEPYRVTFIRKGQGNLSAYCTCPAGENGQYCKHRFRIMAREMTGIVSSNLGDVETVAAWIPGSDIERALHDVHSAEERLEIAKKSLSNSKRALARAMRD